MISINTADISALQKLNAGDIISLSGTIYTARDAAHKRLYALISEDKALPFNLSGAFIYYTGATPARDGEPIGSCGPTTSKRMDVYTPALLERGVKGIIGKGERAPFVNEAMGECGAVYLIAIGGAGAFYQSAVKSSRLIAFPELLSEAIYELQIENFKCVVGTDSRGHTIFD